MTIEQALADLSSVLGERLTRSASDRALHGQSESYFAQTPPDAVAYPETAEEVARIVTTCAAHGCPVIPFGAGTSLEGHTTPIRGGLTVDFARMNRVLEVHPEDMDAVVQPGITRQALNEDLRATGLFFPVDPGANASIGGMAATRASGTTTVRYGSMRDNVLGLQVVLADGRIIRTGTRARKSAAGYDLTHLFIGSEGTLGLITELTLRLHGQPEAISAAVCAFSDIGGAVDTVMATIQMGIPMARIEFIDTETVNAVNAYSNMSLPLKPHLLVEFHGSDLSVAEDARRLGELVEEFGGEGFRWSTQAEDRNALWTMRHNAYFAILASRKGARAVVTDLCVPISRLAEAVEETRADIADSPIPGPILGHVGDGNFHAILMIRDDEPQELETARALSARMVDRALRMGGTVTGEHGVGMGKLDYMEAEHGQGWQVMGEIKRALDPQNILNPGKVVRTN
ncbi:D-lactate dehydrogenase (cytochrome) [Aliiruegeria haliotis]|uniref:D-lactate dehydrogenase (cytochrome) n=1 Tax=Aliiruegeria haliotis TaxID=1280846 RepID=A0A2T0RXV7_9RHOB|nr:FAD-linked oxidase C-terminal domain-containing protein [Aliiruegeria haliotis]PRY26015.1 D-lactate dehydrogenase (cytochrome) [Aliiruegeria haliotis]